MGKGRAGMLTVADLMTHLAVQLDTTLGGTLEAKVRTAALAGWARLMTMRHWAYFHRSGSVRVYAGVSDGTVSYDSSSQSVTLTGSSWPADVTAKHIRLRQNWYAIARRVSNSVVTLYPGQSPSTSLTGEAYLLQQVLYPLPYDVGDVVQMLEGQQNLQMMRLSILEAHQLQEGPTWTPSLPRTFALVGDSANPQRWSLWLPSQQSIDTELQYLYIARKPPSVLVLESRGLCSVSNGVATFTDAVVAKNWANAVLRVSSTDADVPTGEFGDLTQADVQYNPSAEMRVTDVLSDTQCRVTDVSVSFQDKAFTASSFVDCADGVMQSLLLRLIEHEYGVRMVGGHQEMLVSARRLADAFNDAVSADGRDVRNKGALGRWYGLRLQDIGSPRRTS